MRTLQKFLLAVPLFALHAKAQNLTLTHVTLLDTRTGASRPDTTVMIRGDRIISITPSVGSSPRLTGPKEDLVVDATGQYLIPGLWDMHTHVYFGRTTADGSDLILPLFIANGVTGIRDMGSELNAILHAREEIAAHRMTGPRMIVSGPMLDGASSQYAAAIPIVTPEEGRRAVAMLKHRGVNFIKIQSGVPREAYLAIAKESNKQGIEFEGHVPDAVRASEAVAAGQRTFEHLIGIFEASSPDEDKYLAGKKTPGMFLATYDSVREAGIVKLLAERHVWQCPTLFWERGQWLVDAVDYTKDPDLAYAGHSWVETQWPASQKAILASLDTDPLPVRERFVEHELSLVRKLHAANVPFLAGTDTPAGVDVIPGVSLHLELERFVTAGFTPLEALQTATLNPAIFLHKEADFGTIETGKIADLVLLEANPFDNIANTRKITGVVADGHYLSRSDLDALKARLKQLAATK